MNGGEQKMQVFIRLSAYVTGSVVTANHGKNTHRIANAKNVRHAE